MSLTPPPEEITLLTLNCWGLLHLSALRAPRLLEIGRQIARQEPTPHIVCLQECWTQADYEAICSETSHLLPFTKFYFSGAFGGGLAILSKWPIEDSTMVPYPLNGRPTAFWRGDWYVGKGVACASIRYGGGADDMIDVYNTHTHAPYESGPKDSYLCHRNAQAWHISKLIDSSTTKRRLTVALGDFNMIPLSLAHRIIEARSPVRDVWRVLHPDSSLGPHDHPAEQARGKPVPRAAFNLAENGSTSDGVYNTWRWSKAMQNKLTAGHDCPVDPDKPDPKGKRLDYIFASVGVASKGSSSGYVVADASVCMTERHPTLKCSLSDHFGVIATLKLHHQGGRVDTTDFDAQLRYPDSHRPGLSLADYDEILAMTEQYVARETWEQRWRGYHFYTSLLVWVGCLVAVWFSPRNFVSFILVLISSLGLASGVVNGLLALLFFSWELRGLREFEWEVRNSKTVAAKHPLAAEEEPKKASSLA